VRMFIGFISAFLTAIVLCTNVMAGDKINVVTTTSDLAAIASSIAGEYASVKSICTGQEDPHFIQAKPSFIMLARKANLWIRVGLELEIGWETPILDGSRNTKIRVGTDGHLDASEGIIRLEVPTQKVDRSMGDVHPLGNPHYWLDPWNGRVMARSIRDRLKKLDPTHAAAYDANCTAFEKRLDESLFGKELVEKIDAETLWQMELAGRLEEGLMEKRLSDELGGWLGAMRPYRGSKIITYHRSWVYFADRYGLGIVAELEPKPGIPPSPGHLVEVIQTAKVNNVKVLLVEPFYEKKGPEFVASKTGATLVVAGNSVGGQPEASDYVSMLDNIVRRVTTALSSGTK